MKIPPRPDSSHQEDGFSLSLVLVASLMVLLGGLMLVDRSSDGVISAAFQRESSDAKDAAETGITRIVGELNRPQNRGLLVKKTSDEDPTDGYLWRAGASAEALNACQADPSDLATNPSLGYTASGPYNRVLLNKSGQVVSSEADASKAYRLLWVKRQPLVAPDGNPLLRIFQPTGRGQVTLAVEGSALRNGQTISSVRLEEQLQLVPKCCGVPFGGQHGNVNYGTGSDGASVCFGANWGFVGGAANKQSGYIKINGITTIQTGATPPQPVNPITCIGADPADCDFDPTSTPFTLQMSPIGLPPIPPFQEDTTPPRVPGRIERNASTLLPNVTAFAACYSSYTIDASTLAADPADPLTCKPASTQTVVLNAGVDEANIPSYCDTYLMETEKVSDKKEGLHCKLAVLDYSAFNIVVINTHERPLRLYFESDGPVVKSGGGKTLSHEVLPSKNGKMTDFALFGCAACTSQEISLAGGVNSLDLWAWFPHGSVTISGGSNYSGVLWADEIVSNGGVTWTVPGSGVAQAMELAGHGVPADNTTTSNTNPLVFDWVARAVERFRWFGR